jgi:membrane protease YdiL (CAAX protease family)
MHFLYYLFSATISNMSSLSKQALSNQQRAIRAVLSLLLPAGTAVIVSFLAGMFWDTSALSNQAAAAVLLSSAAVVSLLLGILWYGIGGMGLRGGRALTAGLGFASLLWIIFLILRFFFVDIAPSAIENRPPNAGRTYIYLLLFEAFATQIWTYGLIFHAVADWRGPITAIFVSGLIFGLAAILLFQESFTGSYASMIYFIIWGFLYAIIRLRTGSLLGTAIVQSVQSFTTWIVLAPFSLPDIAQLNNLYVSAVIAYLKLLSLEAECLTTIFSSKHKIG